MAHGVFGFNPWSIDSIVFGPVARQHIMVRTHGGENTREGEREKGAGGSNILFKDSSSKT